MQPVNVVTQAGYGWTMTAAQAERFSTHIMRIAGYHWQQAGDSLREENQGWHQRFRTYWTQLPSLLAWTRELSVDLVIEGTGVFINRSGASKHLQVFIMQPLQQLHMSHLTVRHVCTHSFHVLLTIHSTVMQLMHSEPAAMQSSPVSCSITVRHFLP